MPPDVKDWLEQALIDRGFSGYEEFAQLLKEKGFDISHAAVHRHGQQLEKRLARIQASTQAAELIAKAAPDEQDNRSAAVMAMLQTSLFDALMDMEEAEALDPDKRIPLLAKASQGFAKLAESSIKQKKHQAEVIARLDALANKKDDNGKPWLSKEKLDHIKKAVYGI